VGSRKVTILDAAVDEVAKIAFFIENEGLPGPSKKFVDDAFKFFNELSNKKIVHRPCKYLPWLVLNYRAQIFVKKTLLLSREFKRDRDLRFRPSKIPT